MIEIWKDIRGYEGLYQVSSLGRVKSLAKEILIKKWVHQTPRRTLPRFAPQTHTGI